MTTTTTRNRDLAIIERWPERLRAFSAELQELAAAAERLAEHGYAGAEGLANSAANAGLGIDDGPVGDGTLRAAYNDLERLLAAGGDLGAYEYHFHDYLRSLGRSERELEEDIMSCCNDPDHDADRLRAYRRYRASLGESPTIVATKR
jgi:hypothetical protein